jgi:hypothetical protein
MDTATEIAIENYFKNYPEMEVTIVTIETGASKEVMYGSLNEILSDYDHNGCYEMMYFPI